MLKTQPANLGYTLELAQVYSDLGLYTEAESLFVDMITKTNHGEMVAASQLGLAFLRIYQNEPREALSYLRRQ